MESSFRALFWLSFLRQSLSNRRSHMDPYWILRIHLRSRPHLRSLLRTLAVDDSKELLQESFHARNLAQKNALVEARSDETPFGFT